MTRQRMISDARRRAKALSRADASSYQACLDEVARSTGAADWSSFVAEPRPLPPVEAPVADAETATGGEAIQAPDPANKRGGRYHGIWNDPVDWNRISRLLREETHVHAAIVFLAFAALLLLFRSPVAHYAMQVPPWITLILLCGTLIGGALILVRYLAVSTMGALICSVMGCRRRPMLGIRYWTRMWGDVALRATLAGTLFFGFAENFPDLAFGTSQKDASSMWTDAQEARQVAFARGDLKPLLLGPVSSRGSGSIAELVVIDLRATPRQFRSIGGVRSVIDQGMMQAVVDHPVIRIRGRVDCAKGTFRKISLVAADTVKAPAAYETMGVGRKWVRMTPESLALICPRKPVET